MSMLHEARAITNTQPEPTEMSSASANVEFTFPSPFTEEDPRVTGLVAGVPLSFLEVYADLAVRHAHVQEVERNHWFAEVKGLPGAWGDGSSLEDAMNELHQAIVGWVALKLEAGTEVPAIEGFDLNSSRRLEQAS